MSLDGGMAIAVAEWRRKALANELGMDEMRQWIEHVRGSRATAATTSARARAKKAPVDLGGLMDELDNI